MSESKSSNKSDPLDATLLKLTTVITKPINSVSSFDLKISVVEERMKYLRLQTSPLC